MFKALACSAAVLILGATSVAEAQLPWYMGGGPRYYGYPYFSSTRIEGAQRGLAEVIRARGEAYEAGSRGLVNYQDAVSRYIDNKRKWINAYHEIKRTAQAERRREFEETREAWKKYLETKGSSYPPRLSPSELDPTTGRINWPEPLMGDAYAELRRDIQELFLLRAHAGSSRSYSGEIHQKAREMQAELKDHIREMVPMNYIAARNFLESLAYEGRYPRRG